MNPKIILISNKEGEGSSYNNLNKLMPLSLGKDYHCAKLPTDHQMATKKSINVHYGVTYKEKGVILGGTEYSKPSGKLQLNK